jgi:hypothetical protein
MRRSLLKIVDFTILAASSGHADMQYEIRLPPKFATAAQTLTVRSYPGFAHIVEFFHLPTKAIKNFMILYYEYL